MRKNIAVVTQLISPYRGTENAISWKYVQYMSEQNNLFVFYSSRPFGYENSDISKWQKENSLPNVTFIDAHQDDFVFKIGERIERICPSCHVGSGVLVKKSWLVNVCKKITELSRTTHIDCVHFLNPCGFRTLSSDWKLPTDIPIIYGSIQGVEPTPWCLVKEIIRQKHSFSFVIDYFIRKTVLMAMFCYSPSFKKALSKASLVMSCTPATKLQIDKYHNKKNLFIPNIAIASIESACISWDGKGPLELLWVGTLDHRKNLHLCLDVLATLKNENWRLTVVGDGPLKQNLHVEAKKKKIDDKIVWKGRVNYSELFQIYEGKHLLMVTTCRDVMPCSVFEVMSKGMPVMTLDHCFMSVAIDDSCGVKIPITNYSGIINRFNLELRKILETPQIINQLSQGTEKTIEKFGWGRHKVFLNNLFDKVVKHENPYSSLF